MKILNNSLVYRHVRLDTNEVFYIGISISGKKRRAYTNDNRNKHWHNIVNKIKGEYRVDIIFDDLTVKEAQEKEKELIALYGRRDLNKGPLCNLTNGGEGVLGIRFTEETCKKMSIDRKGRKHSEARKLAMKGILAGENNPNFGKKIPDWHKEINRKAQLGRKHTLSHVENRAEKHRKKVIDLSKNIVFESIGAAAFAFDVSIPTMGRWVKKEKHNLKLYSI